MSDTFGIEIVLPFQGELVLWNANLGRRFTAAPLHSALGYFVVALQAEKQVGHFRMDLNGRPS